MGAGDLIHMRSLQQALRGLDTARGNVARARAALKRHNFEQFKCVHSSCFVVIHLLS
jgi:hypothetical protein